MKEAVLIVTRDCNYHCSFCEIAHKPILMIGEEGWRQIIRRLKTWGVKVFGLSGGEPTLYGKLLLGMLDEIKPNKAFLISNGSVINSGLAGMRLANALLSAGLYGYSSSIDDEHLLHSRDHGHASMLKMLSLGCQDVTASLTAYAGNIEVLPDQIRMLSEDKIWSVVSIVHSTAKPHPVKWVFRQSDVSALPTQEQVVVFSQRILAMYDDVLIHTPRSYFEKLPEVYAIDGNFKWHCERPHYIQVDADGRFMSCPDLVAEENVLALTEAQAEQVWKFETRPCPGCFYACEAQSHEIEDAERMVFK